MATLSLRGLQMAACTTAVAPAPANRIKIIIITIINEFIKIKTRILHFVKSLI